MNCQTAVELLPWLLNGTLDDAERLEVLEHLEGCVECRGELAHTRDLAALLSAHPAPEQLVDHAEGRPVPGLAPEELERHLTACETCTEEMALIREARRGLRLDEGSTPEPTRQAGEGGRVLRGRWTERSWRQLAIAASVAMALITGGWIWSSLSTLVQTKELEMSRHELQAELTERTQALANLREELAGLRASREEPGLDDAERDRLDALSAAVERLEQERADRERRLAGLDRQVAELSAPTVASPVMLYPEEGSRLRGEEPAAGEELPTLSRSKAGRQPLQLSPATGRFGASKVRLELLDPSGERGWTTVTTLPDGPVDSPVLMLDPSRLAIGTHTVRVLTEDGSQELARFRFRVEE
jgi:anti-sigma factor RsiW